MPRFLVMSKLSPEGKVKLGMHQRQADASRAAWAAAGAIEECAYYAISDDWDQLGIITAPSREVLMGVLAPVIALRTTQRVEVIELLTAGEAQDLAQW